MPHLISLSPFWAVMFLQVAARTETSVRRRTQAMSRSCSKRKSRFSSLWGLDTTSKKKTKAHPSINQVCEAFLCHIKWFYVSMHTSLSIYLAQFCFELWPIYLLFVFAGLCWWRGASEKAHRWYICWFCQGTHSKEKLFILCSHECNWEVKHEWELT